MTIYVKDLIDSAQELDHLFIVSENSIMKVTKTRIVGMFKHGEKLMPDFMEV